MFTGIVEEVGTVRQEGAALAVEAAKVLGDTGPGSSISVNGVCLTTVVVESAADGDRGTMRFDLSAETLARTALGRLRPGHTVNLERPVTLLTRLGGHLVQGHVDGVGEIVELVDASSGKNMMVKLPDDLRSYVVRRGSICVDGVSLTVTEVGGDRFGVALVPFTLEATTFRRAQTGDLVNLEVDVVAKYVEGFLKERTR